MKESVENLGATIMGRNMFGGHPGRVGSEQAMERLVGEDPPYHHPVFVLTHHPRETLVLEGGNSFTFVTDGIESALEQAQRAARGKGCVARRREQKAAQQYLKADLVDEMELSIAPTLLGSGERLFEGLGDNLHGLELVRTVAAPDVIHLKLARR
jgi:dihydrofolate reductase